MNGISCKASTCFLELSERTFSFLFYFSHSTGHENLSRNHKQEPKLSFLVKALYTYAYALQAYKDDVCGRDYVGACQSLKKSFNHSLFFVSADSVNN